MVTQSTLRILIVVLSLVLAVSTRVIYYPSTTQDSFEISNQTCPYNCSNHGDCDTDSGICSCFSGWGGYYCNYAFLDLSNGTAQEGNVTTNSTWQYFSWPQRSSDLLIFSVNLTSSGNVEIYAKFGGPPDWPDISYYDFYNDSKVHPSLYIQNPPSGNWIVGIKGSGDVNFTITALAYFVCPNGCSGFGTCNLYDGKCKCDKYYVQPDCSTAVIPMDEGTEYSGSTLPHKWIFYTFSVPSLGVNQLTASIQGTASLYASFIGQPTLFSYNFTTYESSTIQIFAPQAGELYFGVYSFSEAQNYSIICNSSLSCPNDCSIGGTCNTTTGECMCKPNYSGPDCSQVNVTMQAQTNYPGALQPKSWAYYIVSVPTMDYAITVQINETTFPPTNGLYLYALQDVPPTLYEYAYLASPPDDFSVTNSIFIQQAVSTVYYFGVYSVSDATFSISTNYSVMCPNGCSGNGECLTNGTCACSPNWNAFADCSQFNLAMTGGQVYNFTIAPGMWHYYSLYVISANQLVFDVKSNSTLCSLAGYVYLGNRPTALTYARAANTSGSLNRLEVIGSALTGQWYLGVYNPCNISMNYSSQGQALSICPNDCSSNGECKGGTCNCIPGYIGTDCSSQDIEIASGDEVSGLVTAAQWNYYHIRVLGTNALLIQVKERDTVGKVWVYVQKGTALPTLSQHTYENVSNTASHTIFIPSVNASGTWNIGCYGSAYLGFDQPSAEYGMIALLGCDEYKDCATCIQDPNCGWCADDAEDPSSGICTAGNNVKPFSGTCVAWLFSTCSVESEQKKSSFLGVIIGAALGGAVVVVLMIAAIFIYKMQRNRERKYYAPAASLPSGVSDDATVAEGEPFYHSFPRGGEKERSSAYIT